ncbi:class I SAM-dependent methyltransferase [Sneathiella sp. P13V-1]|uniref:class I SAM-dependent methyltransferase n=1 Tax=Sneathiella sp. P13V-1 TaxID=2697366 RepID=UPI00187B34D2|nr:class I SAM-dependent methyltransferase [Sneathiella sp. P13V-1]MBE7635331.1 class I SAM-dependent methyltransferase [Sneathiella sp. P13V-1]
MRRTKNGVVEFSARDTFSGRGIIRHVSSIQKLANVTGAASILDFGSGKGEQYIEDLRTKSGDIIADSLHAYWGVGAITCYDPAVNEDQTPLEAQYDGVIATNVLDHLPEEDLPWIVDLLFEKAEKFVYANMSEHPANAYLPNGENARITKKSADWWVQLFSSVATKYPHIRFCLGFARHRTDNEGNAEVAMTHFHTCPDLELPSSFYLGLHAEGEAISIP